MCGIAGIFNSKHSIDGDIIMKMNDSLIHRGPDDEGYLAVNTIEDEVAHLGGKDSKVELQNINSFQESANLWLGHRRLSILDTTPAGHQPMFNKDQSLWIIFNGEIYNYIELRQELTYKGYTFTTNTDTEVLLAAYEAWGESCLNKLNGMWSFVIYNKNDNVLFGARDRLGVKPLYYYLKDGVFAFASEMRVFSRNDAFEASINDEMVFDYLVMNKHQENNDFTFLNNVQELKHSHAFTYDLTNFDFKSWQYYRLEYSNTWERYDEDRAKAHENEVRTLLYNAIKLRLQSDVPIGSCLSGGLDSAAIVTIINDLLKKSPIKQVGSKQKVFTIGYNDKTIDESNWAKMVVEKTKTEWHLDKLSGDGIEKELEEFVTALDIPTVSLSSYAQFRVMKLARDNGVKVLLDGQGGDELFGGYDNHYVGFFSGMLQNLAFNNLLHEWSGLKNAPVNKKFILLQLAKPMFRRLVNPLWIKGKIKCVSNDMISAFKHRTKEKQIGKTDTLNRTLYNDTFNGKLQFLLRAEDRNSMHFSIESRTPFADDVHLMEYLFKVPSVYKIHDGWSKHLMRRALKDTIPHDVLYRKDKIGFATPQAQWMTTAGEQLKGYLTEEMNDYLNTAYLKNNWQQLVSDEQTNLWRFVNFAIWKRLL